MSHCTFNLCYSTQHNSTIAHCAHYILSGNWIDIKKCFAYNLHMEFLIKYFHQDLRAPKHEIMGWILGIS
jgi:hypothetical protein